MPAGETVPEFTATAFDGGVVSRDQLPGRTIIGFLASGCARCTEQLPAFLEYAGSMPGGWTQAIAVVIGDFEDVDTEYEALDIAYLERLAPVVQLVLEKPDGPMQQAFRVTRHPAFYLVDSGGVVAAAGAAMAASGPVPWEQERHQP